MIQLRPGLGFGVVFTFSVGLSVSGASVSSGFNGLLLSQFTNVFNGN